MHHQMIRPAGAERETLWVLVAAVVIVAVAVAVVGLNRPVAVVAVPLAHEIDARADLTAAEQGLHADLLAAAGEIMAMVGTEDAAPSPAVLAADLLPPFIADASAEARGGHVWSLHRHGATLAYAGVSAKPAVAGSLVLILHGGQAEVWLTRAAEAPPLPPDPPALIAAGWRRVMSTFSAGVTR